MNVDDDNEAGDHHLTNQPHTNQQSQFIAFCTATLSFNQSKTMNCLGIKENIDIV